MTLFDILLIAGLSSTATWLLSERRRATAIADRDRIGTELGTYMAKEYGEAICIGECTIKTVQRSAFLRQFLPDGFSQVGTAEFTLAGTRYIATITEAEAES